MKTYEFPSLAVVRGHDGDAIQCYTTHAPNGCAAPRYDDPSLYIQLCE